MKYGDYIKGFNDGIVDAERKADTIRGTQEEKIARLGQDINEIIDELNRYRDDTYYWIGYLTAHMLVRENVK